MMDMLGFSAKLLNWIWGCLESSIISIPVNGSLAEQFTPTKGLRQGDF